MDRRLELRPIQADTGDNSLLNRNRRNGVFRNSTGPPPERRSTISGMMPAIYENTTRVRNLSGGSSGSAASGSSLGSSINLDNHISDSQVFLSTDMLPFANTSFNSSSTVPQSRSGSSLSHRKFDRSYSDSDSDRLSNGSQRSVNSSRYKTELCRPFEESGSCKYGDKCQFAHGMHELRNLARHPKYKTELCRTFHSSGLCPYGPRCHFIHADEGKVESSPKVSRQTRSSSCGHSHTYSQSSSSGSSSPSLSPSGSDNDYNFFNYLDSTSTQTNGSVENSQFNNSLSANINNKIQALESHFNSALNLNRNFMNDNSNFGGTFSSYGDQVEEDIFSKITMFNTEEVDNICVNKAPVQSGHSMQSIQLDNFPPMVDTAFWPMSIWNQSGRPTNQGPFHHSPTGSLGSDGIASDCSGSTESLDSCREISGYLLQH